MEYKINIYEIQGNGRCKAALELIDLNLFIGGFVVVPGPNGRGVIVHMPKGMGTDWKYKEIEWAYVRSIISEEYLKHPRIREILKSLYTNDIEMKKENRSIINAGAVGKLPELYVNLYNFESETGDCLAGIILPKSKIRLEGFKVKNNINGGLSVYMPQHIGTTWKYEEIAWKSVQQKITEQYQNEKKYVESSKTEIQEKNGFAVDDEEDNITATISEEMEIDTTDVEKAEPSEKKKQFMSLRNQMQRVRNAEKTAFAFVPQSILKLVKVSVERKNLTRQIVYAINSPQGGIGPFEIEILDWVSRLKYIAKTMILDLVLSGYIYLGERERITATKMTDVMNRLYRYDLIESSNFVSVDDNGNSLVEGSGAKYRIHTLGATGFNLLREMGRHPERRNPFGVLADGNTVKKHLSANQWLVYWLTHYDKSDILDFSVNTIINLIGLKWSGVRIYASINLETASIIAEPVRRCEDFEKESNIIEIQEKMMREIEMLDNEDQLYTSVGEQIVYPTRPIISFICEDDEHMREVAEYVNDIMDEYGQQEVWFTTDIRMFNYNCKGQRFFKLIDGNLGVINLKDKTGLEEMTMEHRGGLLID